MGDWSKRHKEERCKWQREYRKRNRRLTLAQKRRYKQKHRDKVQAGNRRYWRKLRMEILLAYGNCCALCGNKQNLELDHVRGDGKAHRQRTGRGVYAEVRRLGFPKDRFRLLCRSCNLQEAQRMMGRTIRKRCPACNGKGYVD